MKITGEITIVILTSLPVPISFTADIQLNQPIAAQSPVIRLSSPPKVELRVFWPTISTNNAWLCCAGYDQINYLICNSWYHHIVSHCITWYCLSECRTTSTLCYYVNIITSSNHHVILTRSEQYKSQQNNSKFPNCYNCVVYFY